MDKIKIKIPKHGGVHQKGERLGKLLVLAVVVQGLCADKGAVVERCVQVALLGERAAHGPQTAAGREELHVEDPVKHFLCCPLCLLMRVARDEKILIIIV